MYDMPGLDTVHCWSKVRSRVDCRHDKHHVVLRTPEGQFTRAIFDEIFVAHSLQFSFNTAATSNLT